MFSSIFSSPEPSRRLNVAQGELIVYQSSRRLSGCVSTFLNSNISANSGQIVTKFLSEPSFGWVKGCIRFWARSDRTSGVHGNG